jgi:cation diffusion facilitator CzcD-associated flavoprotein CzcO
VAYGKAQWNTLQRYAYRFTKRLSRYDNTYPGCGVDIESVVYSYSFAPNCDWSREFPTQKEILAYLTRVAQEYGLYEHIRFGSTATEATWDDGLMKWRTSVKIAKGSKEAECSSEYTITSDFLVSAVGQLSQPKWPKIEGMDSFAGKQMHSARWDWTYDISNKKIAVVGSGTSRNRPLSEEVIKLTFHYQKGCSAVQIVPEIAKIANKVTVFQRTPHWIVARGDYLISDRTRTLYRYLPYLQRHKRKLQVDSNEAGQAAFIRTLKDNEKLRQIALDMMHEQLPNQQGLWEKLTPEFAMGCKRIVASDLFYPALNRPNVQLETRKIHSITDQTVCVVGADGQPEDADSHYDLIVYATGFRANEFLFPMTIHGRNGRDLHEMWKDGAQAYLGTCALDMPNFGMVLGPNTALGHNSFILMIEAQSRYINGLIKPVLEARRQGQELSLSPRHDIVEDYNVKLQEALQSMAASDPSCNSWYKTDSGRVTNLWPGLVLEYQQLLERVNYREFEAEGSGNAIVRKVPSYKVGRVVEEAGALDKLGLRQIALLGTSTFLAWLMVRTLLL